MHLLYNQKKSRIVKYKKIWDKISNTIQKEFYSRPVNNKQYLTTSVKFYEGETNTVFHGKKLPQNVSDNL